MMTDIDKFTFNDPAAGDWNEYELSVQREKNGPVQTFSAETWVYKITIEVVRKPKVINPGSIWRGTGLGDARVIGLIEDNGQIYIAYIDSYGDSILQKETDFRIEYNGGPR
jgi:hypothetical protein